MSDEPVPDDATSQSPAGDTLDAGPSTSTSTPTGEADPDSHSRRDAGDTGGGRSVVVPDRVYKTVTVFSTLIAIVMVVVGFVVLDRATNRAQAPIQEIDPLLALAGIALMVLGAVTYAFSTRFRAEGMGNAKDDTDEPSNNG